MGSRERVLEALAAHAYRYSETPFTLRSGQSSHEYINCKTALCRGEVLAHVGSFVFHAVREWWVGVRAVGGLTMGADPIAVATSVYSATVRSDVDFPAWRWFSVRKERKGHGARDLLVGDVSKGQRVLVVDDVATTGGSTIQAIQACMAAELDVVGVFVLVDREQGGLDAIRAVAPCPANVVEAAFTLSEVREAAQRLGPVHVDR